MDNRDPFVYVQVCACHLRWYLHLLFIVNRVCSVEASVQPNVSTVLANGVHTLLTSHQKGWNLTGRNSKLTGYMTDQSVKNS